MTIRVNKRKPVRIDYHRPTAPIKSLLEGLVERELDELVSDAQFGVSEEFAEEEGWD